MTAKRLAPAAAGLVLTLLLSACSALSLTPIPTATATLIPTPTPTLTPTPPPLLAQEILDAAVEALQDADTYHFDLTMQMNVATVDGSLTMKVPLTMVTACGNDGSPWKSAGTFRPLGTSFHLKQTADKSRALFSLQTRTRFRPRSPGIRRFISRTREVNGRRCMRWANIP